MNFQRFLKTWITKRWGGGFRKAEGTKATQSWKYLNHSSDRSEILLSASKCWVYSLHFSPLHPPSAKKKKKKKLYFLEKGVFFRCQKHLEKLLTNWTNYTLVSFNILIFPQASFWPLVFFQCVMLNLHFKEKHGQNTLKWRNY